MTAKSEKEISIKFWFDVARLLSTSLAVITICCSPKKWTSTPAKVPFIPYFHSIWFSLFIVFFYFPTLISLSTVLTLSECHWNSVEILTSYLSFWKECTTVKAHPKVSFEEAVDQFYKHFTTTNCLPFRHVIHVLILQLFCFPSSSSSSWRLQWTNARGSVTAVSSWNFQPSQSYLEKNFSVVSASFPDFSPRIRERRASSHELPMPKSPKVERYDNFAEGLLSVPQGRWSLCSAFLNFLEIVSKTPIKKSLWLLAKNARDACKSVCVSQLPSGENLSLKLKSCAISSWPFHSSLTLTSSKTKCIF